MPAISHKASVATIPGMISTTRRRPAGSHLCAPNSATVRTTTEIAKRKIVRAKDSRERGQHNEERKHRHQRGKSDVAGNRPTVVSEEVPVSVDGDVERSSHRSVNSRMGNPNPGTRYPKHSTPFQVVNNAATIVQTRGNVRAGLPWRCFCAPPA